VKLCCYSNSLDLREELIPKEPFTQSGIFASYSGESFEGGLTHQVITNIYLDHAVYDIFFEQ
jgi:hypothetical protein